LLPIHEGSLELYPRVCAGLRQHPAVAQRIGEASHPGPHETGSALATSRRMLFFTAGGMCTWARASLHSLWQIFLHLAYFYYDAALYLPRLGAGNNAKKMIRRFFDPCPFYDNSGPTRCIMQSFQRWLQARPLWAEWGSSHFQWCFPIFVPNRQKEARRRAERHARARSLHGHYMTILLFVTCACLAHVPLHLESRSRQHFQ